MTKIINFIIFYWFHFVVYFLAALWISYFFSWIKNIQKALIVWAMFTGFLFIYWVLNYAIWWINWFISIVCWVSFSIFVFMKEFEIKPLFAFLTGFLFWFLAHFIAIFLIGLLFSH